MTAWAVEADSQLGAFRVALRMSRVLYHETSAHHEIALFENPLFGRVLTLNGVVQTTERDEFFYHEMLVHLPVFAHGHVRRVLVVGGGDGGAIEELFKHAGIEAVTLVEIDASVVEFSKTHLRAICGGAFEDPRLTLAIADGAAWVAEAAAAARDGGPRFDLILIDSTDPAAAGPAEPLFTGAFYRDCAALLAEDGLLVTQNSVPFSEPVSLVEPLTRLRSAFGATACYRVAVPSYYGGDMVFTLAAKDAARLEPDPEALAQRTAAAGIATRYYTPAIHQGAFALPPFIAELIG